MGTVLHGYCERSVDEIEQIVKTEGLAPLRRLDGEYVIVLTGGGLEPHVSPDETVIIASPHGHIQYFYVHEAGRFSHGYTVLDVLKASGLPWRWDYRTLGDLAFLGQVIGTDTLHPNIRRLGPAEMIRARGERMTRDSLHFDDLHPVTPTTADELLEVFNDELSKEASDDAVISFSGGFDSRVVLSGFLALGLKPSLLVMGYPHTTDVRLAEAMARATGLEIERVELSVDKYLENGKHISAITSGVKTADNWHTWIYPNASSYDRSRLFYAGNGAEYVRTDALTLGNISRLVNRLPPKLFLPIFWNLKRKHPFDKRQLEQLAPALRESLTEGKRGRIARMVSMCPGRVLEALDHYYLTQRVRGFHSSGYRLYSDTFPTRVPFLSRAWISRARGLERHWKLGSNWHRHAIVKNAPVLATFPSGIASGTDRGVPDDVDDILNRRPMDKKARPFYWVDTAVKKGVHYANYPEWFRDERVLERLQARRDAFEGLWSAEFVDDLVARQRAQGGAQTLVGLILSMSYWMDNLKDTLPNSAT